MGPCEFKLGRREAGSGTRVFLGEESYASSGEQKQRYLWELSGHAGFSCRGTVAGGWGWGGVGGSGVGGLQGGTQLST